MPSVAQSKSSKKRRTAKAKPVLSPAKVRGPLGKPNLTRELRTRLRLNQPVFAKLLPVSVRTLVTLESGAPATEAVSRRLAELERLTNALADVMKEESLGNWLQTPNSAFDRLKPLEVIERDSDRIWSMIHFLRSGAPA